MKITKLSLYFLTLATGCLIMLSSCNKENISTSVTEENGEIALKSGNNGPSASGQGTFSWGEGEIIRHISFHANTMPQGNVKGNGVLTWNAGANRLHFDIDCLSIDDNTAIVTGIITRSIYPHQVGAKFWFKVADNGEGSNSSPDQVTWLYLGLDEDCSFDYGYEFLEIEGGNIQVSP